MLPLRQKILIGTTVLWGLTLITCSSFGLLRQNTLNEIISLYGFIVPVSLLTLDTVVDLNDKTIFGIWFAISILTFTISLTTYNDIRFITTHSTKFNLTANVDSFISQYSTSSLKTLLAFLVMYWLLNKFLNKKGMFVINTFRQASWYHNIAQRKITGLDILINVILYIVTVTASLFGP